MNAKHHPGRAILIILITILPQAARGQVLCESHFLRHLGTAQWRPGDEGRAADGSRGAPFTDALVKGSSPPRRSGAVLCSCTSLALLSSPHLTAKAVQAFCPLVSSGPVLIIYHMCTTHVLLMYCSCIAHVLLLINTGLPGPRHHQQCYHRVVSAVGHIVGGWC